MHFMWIAFVSGDNVCVCVDCVSLKLSVYGLCLCVPVVCVCVWSESMFDRQLIV